LATETAGATAAGLQWHSQGVVVQACDLPHWPLATFLTGRTPLVRELQHSSDMSVSLELVLTVLVLVLPWRQRWQHV